MNLFSCSFLISLVQNKDDYVDYIAAFYHASGYTPKDPKIESRPPLSMCCCLKKKFRRPCTNESTSAL